MSYLQMEPSTQIHLHGKYEFEWLYPKGKFISLSANLPFAEELKGLMAMGIKDVLYLCAAIEIEEPSA